MECITLQQDSVDVVVYLTRAWQVFICLVFGIFGGISITIIVLICWIHVFKKGKNCKKICCFCCLAVGTLKRGMRKSSSAMSEMMLAAWNDEESHSDEDSELAGETISVFVEDEEGHERILRHDNSLVEKTSSDTESAGCERFNVPISQKSVQKSLADILTQPDWEARNMMMFENEKNAILKTESEFIRQKSELFLFMLDCVTTQIVRDGHASEHWKQSLKDYCENMFIRTKKRTQSHSVANFVSSQPRMPESFQINMNGVITTLFEHLKKGIENESEVGEMEADVIVNEFQTNWSAFERIHSDVYLKHIKELSHNFKQQVQIMELIEQEVNELMSEMVQHVDKHVNALKRLRIRDPYNIDLPTTEDRLVPELEEIWQSSLDHFQMDLRRQEIQLSMELREELEVEKKKLTTNYEQEIQAIQEAVMSENGNMNDYVDKYCEMIESKFAEQIRLEQLEMQLTASGFSSLTESVGNRYLKMGLKSESDLYTSYLERTNWVEPSVSNLLSQHQQNLAKLHMKLKELRKTQYGRLQAQINRRMEDTKQLESKTATDMDAQYKSIKEVVELQADLSEMERQQLLDQCMAQQKSFEAQLELNRVKQERRLEQRLRQQRAKLAKALEDVHGSSANPEKKVGATLEYKQEEKQLLESHQQSMEELKKKMSEEIEAAKKEQELIFQQKIEHLRRGHERRMSLANKQEKAIKSLKNKLLNRLANGAEQTEGERIIKEHQINKDVLEETIQKNKLYQQQVLQQKLQARKLDKEKDIKKVTHVESYRPGSAKRFAANTLVALLYGVRHKRAMKEMEVQLAREGQRIKSQIEKKFKIHSKLELQLREAEMVANLATTLGMTRHELESELKKSVQEQGDNPDSEYGILLSRSVLRLFDGTDINT